MKVIRATAWMAIYFLFVSSVLAQANQKKKLLSAADESVLRTLLKDFLYVPPTDAVRVRIQIKAPGWSEWADEQTREGWLVREKAGKRVYFTDGESVPAPAKGKIEKFDFVARWSEVYKEKPEPEANPGGFNIWLLEFPADKGGGEPTLVIAAWLYHFGKTELAAQVIAHAPRDRAKEVAVLKKWLAGESLNRMLQCFGRHEDQAALDHGERLMRLYPAEAKKLAQAIPLLEDLRRRKQEGLMGAKSAPRLPAAFAGWNNHEKLAYVINGLDRIPESVSYEQEDSRGFGYKEASPYITALLQMGEAAIPDLLDAIEKDERFTRCVQGPWKYDTIGHADTVRRASLCIIYRILKTRYLDPRDPKAEEVGLGELDFKKIVPAARAYWKEFGPLPFEGRMMRVLTDPKASFPALREAATRLSVPSAGYWTHPHRIKFFVPSPVVLMFAHPTAAEGVLAVMERDLANDDAGDAPDHNRAYHEPLYFSALIQIGDERIAPELARRATNETNALMRLRYAHACFRLGNSRPLLDMARDFALGKVALRTESDPLRWQLEHIVGYFAAVKLPATDEALYKLVEPRHRYHQDALKGIVDRLVVYETAGDFNSHPFYIGLLRKLLDDGAMTPVRMSYREGEGLPIAYGGGGTMGNCIAPDILQDPKMRRAEAAVRRCDLAGEECRLFAGLPEYHPLLKDFEGRLAAIRDAIDKFPGRYRVLTPVEIFVITGNEWGVSFAPDIKPLGRPATAHVGTDGTAIFHLDGKGTLPKLELPACGAWPKLANEKTARACLIVQAEMLADGDIFYGVIEHRAIRMVPASEFAAVTPLSMVKIAK